MSSPWPTADDPITPGWRFVSIGFEDDPVDLGGGANPWPWGPRWVAIGARIVVAHPSYPQQRHAMDVYELDAGGRTVTFAAGEFSNGVWGFFVPAPGAADR